MSVMVKFAWVIVDSRYPELRYYNGQGSNEFGEGWTPDHLKAIRFCRKTDAIGVIMTLPHGWHLIATAEEHGWMERIATLGDPS